jgi:hypothetical protein
MQVDVLLLLLQHCRVEVEELGKLLVKSQVQAPLPSSAARAHQAGGKGLKKKWLQGLMARQSFRAQTGRTPQGYTPSMPGSVSSRLSDVSGGDAVQHFASPPLRPVDGSTMSGLRRSRAESLKDGIRDWLDSSLQSALIDAPLHCREQHAQAASRAEGHCSHSLVSSGHLTSSSTFDGADAASGGASAAETRHKSAASALSLPQSGELGTNGLSSSGSAQSGSIGASFVPRVQPKAPKPHSTSVAGQTGTASGERNESSAQQVDAAPSRLIEPPVPLVTEHPTPAVEPATTTPISLGYTGLRDPMGRPVVADGLLRGAYQRGAEESAVHASGVSGEQQAQQARQGWSWGKVLSVSSGGLLGSRSKPAFPPAAVGKSEAASDSTGARVQQDNAPHQAEERGETSKASEGASTADAQVTRWYGLWHRGSEGAPTAAPIADATATLPRNAAVGATNGLPGAQTVVPLATIPAAKQVGRWEWFKGKVGFGAGKGSEGQERGDGAVAANAAALSTRHVEESKAHQTAAEQAVEQGGEMESRDVVHETTSVGKSTLVGSSALLSSVSTNRPPQVMGQASANVGACAAGIQGQATAHVGTAAGVPPADAAAGSQDATVDKSIDSHAVKAHGSKRERLKDTLQRSLDSLNSLG